MKHIFIVNPTSGVGNYKDVTAWIEANMLGLDYKIHITQYEGHATEIAKSYDKGVILYSIGGDGTAYEIINGMSFENEFCVIPVGTGNDFYKMINTKKEIFELLHDTVHGGHVSPVDVGQVNDRYFLNCANIGVDADVNARANGLKGTIVPRLLIYLVSTLREIMTMKPVRLHIFNNEFSYDKDITLLSVMNGKYYGSGFKSAPNAKINDGLFDLVIVDAVSRTRVINLLPKYMKGTHLDLDVVEVKEVDHVEVKSQVPLTIGCDGEIFKSDHLVFKMHKGILKYRLPKGIEL
ncbi:MAG: diacylglycerol kinase family lipid kinase [Erysipelothrix sp.]|nr:diacylglycerol kinase family lipid kinase [Erysipelothrix sp.]